MNHVFSHDYHIKRVFVKSIITLNTGKAYCCHSTLIIASHFGKSHTLLHYIGMSVRAYICKYISPNLLVAISGISQPHNEVINLIHVELDVLFAILTNQHRRGCKLLICNPELQELNVFDNTAFWVNILLKVIKLILKGTVDDDKTRSLAKWRCMALEFLMSLSTKQRPHQYSAHIHPPARNKDSTASNN